MSKSKLAVWLFIYYLGITVSIALSLLLFGPSVLYIDDTSGLFQILIPTLIGQVAVLIKWMGTNAQGPKQKDTILHISPIVVKAPPLLILVMIVITFATKIITHNQTSDIEPGDEQIKLIFTFCISLLNVTTIYLVTLFYGSDNSQTPIPPTPDIDKP